jgi:putative nucleotidyltransferase with HDIG domain
MKKMLPVLRIGDRLDTPVYWQPAGSRGPLLLMAAGQRIESEQQLRRLREAGYSVELPAESSESVATVLIPEPVRPIEIDGFSFRRRLTEAQELRQSVFRAAATLIERLSAGIAPDLEVLKGAGLQLARAVSADPHAMATLTHLRQCDDYTVEHSVDVSILMTALAHVLGYSDSDLPTVALAGLMHDVGKQGVPGKILTKPGPLTREELTMVRRHPEHGERILTATGEAPDAVRAVVLQHHERLDGSGYPFGSGRRQMHPFSLIAAVADTFDALTADRVYRRALSPRQALIELYEEQQRFDDRVMAALIRLVGVYPVGTRVCLTTGETGEVIAPNPLDATRPTVRLQEDAFGQPFEGTLYTNPTDRGWQIAGEA